MRKVVRIGRELLERGEDFVLAKVVETVGSTPRKRNAWMIMDKNHEFYGTVGGGKLEAEVQKKSREIIESRKAGVYDFRLTPTEKLGIDMQCGGDAQISVEYIDHRQAKDFGKELALAGKAFIFGAGHVGKEVETVLSYIGFASHVLDDRQEFANRDRFPDATNITVLADYYTPFADLEIDNNSYIIIVTRGHGWDYEVLKGALSQKAAYIGMIGSQRKNRTIFDKLIKDGFSQQALKRVHAPIGLNIGAETPEEIAISIVAEIIQVKANHEKI